ncbi:HYR domain-containing protein, partial [Gramella sp. KN1008]|uniref:HYR domain-containing protein n=1 Tax=Gramella sp. KN1008 TaxID=2529298 RepID=UPI0010397CAE
IGIYTLTVTDADNGCFGTDTVEVTQDITAPVAEAGDNKELSCTITSITLDGSATSANNNANLSYAWSGPDGFTSDLQSPSVDAIGIYTLTVTDADNGCFGTDTVEVTQDNLSAQANITGNEELTCNITAIILDASSSTTQGDASYEWTMNDDATIIGTGTTLEVTEPGNYSVVVTDSDNGCSNKKTVTVTQDIDTPTADIQGNGELTCITTSITLDASGSSVKGDASYEWTKDTDPTVIGTGNTLEVTEPGTYNVTVTDSDNGCTASTSVDVTQDIDAPTADIQGNEELTCTTTSIILDASGSSVKENASYEWTKDTDPTVIGTGTTLEVTEPGTYNVTVTDSDNGCSASTSVSVTQDTDAPTADIQGNEELSCTTTSIILDAGESSVKGDASYEWTKDTDPSVIGTGTILEVTEPGTYYVTVTDSDNGCSASTSVIVTQDILSVQASITGNEDLDCNNTSIILDASSSTVNGTASYLWNTGAETATIEVAEAGIYSVLVTDTENGCSDETKVTVSFIEDANAPVITECAQELNISSDEGVCTASNVDLGMPMATDNCPEELTITNDAPEVFSLGQTTVTWTITDGSGNTSQCEQIVYVTDNEAPVITCPQDVTVSADTGICSASQVELGMPTVTDNCDADLEITNDAPEVFELGDTTVTWTVIDKAGNSTSCTQLVTVVDDQAPVVETMSNITVDSDPGVCGAVVEFGVVGATDNCELASVEVTEGLISGSEFPIGTTTVTYTVTDSSGNTSTSSFTVTVEDNEAPEVSCPENITATTVTGESYAIVEFADATATDNCEVSVEQTAGPVSGSQFPIGTTTVTFTATDASGNTTDCSFTVTIEDNEDPTLECPSNITQGVDAGVCSAVVEFETPAGLDNSGDVTVTQTVGPASGAEFPVGTTTVTFTATDTAGNTATCSFTVTVNDDEGPQIDNMDNITVNTDAGICGAIVNFNAPGATDNCGVESVVLTEGLDSGSEFPVGETTVTYTVTDTSGNTASSSFTVTVIDNEAPAISCPENIEMTVENGTTSVVIEYAAITTTDNCEGTTVALTEGLASGEEFPIGTTTVTYTATDAAGNSTSCTFTVTIEEEALPNPPATPTATVTTTATCTQPTGTITVETAEGLTYSIDGENYQESGVFADLAPGIYQVTARDEFGQVSTAATITIDEPVADVIQVAADPDLCVEDSVFDLFELLIGDVDESGTWVDTDNTGALDNGFIDPSLMALGTYTFTYELEGNCPSSTNVTVSINDDCVVLSCSIDDVRNSISKVITPNGDSRNDYFKIGEEQDGVDIECNFTYDVKIFNRWGNEIFSKRNYQPRDWNGSAQGSTFGGSDNLPAGTYYYIVEVRNSDFKPITGYIYLGTK